MADHRDPKTTNTGTRKDSGIGKWIGIAVAVLIVLLLLGWLLGWFADGTEVGTANPTVTEESAIVEEPAVGNEVGNEVEVAD